MLKADLVDSILKKRPDLTQRQAEATIEVIFNMMRDALINGESIEIRGIGSFHLKHYRSYSGRNPRTGEVITVKPKRAISFRAGKELRDRLNRSLPKIADDDDEESDE